MLQQHRNAQARQGITDHTPPWKALNLCARRLEWRLYASIAMASTPAATAKTTMIGTTTLAVCDPVESEPASSSQEAAGGGTAAEDCTEGPACEAVATSGAPRELKAVVAGKELKGDGLDVGKEAGPAKGAVAGASNEPAVGAGAGAQVTAGAGAKLRLSAGAAAGAKMAEGAGARKDARGVGAGASAINTAGARKGPINSPGASEGTSRGAGPGT